MRQRKLTDLDNFRKEQVRRMRCRCGLVISRDRVGLSLVGTVWACHGSGPCSAQACARPSLYCRATMMTSMLPRTSLCAPRCAPPHYHHQAAAVEAAKKKALMAKAQQAEAAAKKKAGAAGGAKAPAKASPSGTPPRRPSNAGNQ